ncbi:MAG: peptidylprolyl isomerase [Leptospirillum sp.]
MTRLFRYGGVLAGMLVLASCHFKGPNDEIAGSIGKELITVSDLRHTAAFIGISDLTKGDPSLWSGSVRKAVLAETIQDQLLLDFVRDRRISLPPEEVSLLPKDRTMRELERKRMLIREAIRRIAPRQIVTDQEIRTYYHNHIKRFTLPEEALVRHIVTSDRKEGIEIQKALEGGASFSALAKARSLGVEASTGGLMAPFSKGEMPQPFDEVFDLSPGEVTDLLPSTYGYHLFKLIRLIPGSERPLRQVRGEIRKILIARQRQKLLGSWLSEQEIKKPWKPARHYRKIFSVDLE